MNNFRIHFKDLDRFLIKLEQSGFTISKSTYRIDFGFKINGCYETHSIIKGSYPDYWCYYHTVRADGTIVKLSKQELIDIIG